MTVTIEPPADARLLKEVFDPCLGEDYLSLEFLQAFIQEPGAICRVAIADNTQVVGALIARRLWQPADVLKISRLLSLAYIWGELKTMAVLPDYRGNGIGSKFTRETISHLQQGGCNRCAVEAWKSPNPQNSLGILGRFDFETLIEIPNYWEGANCAECGPGACRCTAVIMTRVLDPLQNRPHS
jgi:ribosomal protein S18 acetylase RimI-like enzyme